MYAKLVTMGATAIGFYRVFIAGLVLVAFVRLRRQPLVSGGALGLLAIASVCYAGDLWVWHQSIKWIGPGLATLLASFQVFILTIVGVAVFRERADWRLYVAIPLALVGLMLLVGLDWSALAPEKRAGVWLGLATAVFYAGYLLALRQARAITVGRTAAGDLALVSIVSAVFLAGASLTAGESLVIDTWWNGSWLTVYAIGSQVVAWVMISSSLPYVPASKVGLLLLLQPTLSFLWDILFFGREIALHEGAGLLIALFAIWLGSQRVKS